jgi:DNA-binding response OmpR family regulator
MASPVPRVSPVITEPFEIGGNRRVLVVDADPSSRSILEVALKRAGFDVASATSGREGLQLLSGGRAPKVVVVSSQLHGEDGYSFVAQLRADGRNGKLPVLLLARADEDEKSTLADVVGADDLVAKPAFARDVAALVTLWTAERDATGAYQVNTPELPLSVTLRALLSTQRAGQIILGKRTFVAYRAGRVTHAEADGVSGLDALLRVLTLGQGAYKVSFTIPTRPSTLEVPLRELVNAVFPRLQKWEALAARSVPLDARFQVDFPALAKALPTIPDAVNEVVRLFDGQRDVRQVLFDSPLNETVTLEVANRLHLMGVVQPVEAHADALLPRLAPRLFEPKETEAEERMSTLFGDASDLQDAIVTPVETPAPGPSDWWQPPKGTGLEVDNATDGWVEQQLSAFKIQSVVEPSEPNASEAEIAAFNAGTGVSSPDQPTLLEQAIAPIQLTEAVQVPTGVTQALEDQFFGDDGSEDTDPSVPTVAAREASEPTDQMYALPSAEDEAPAPRESAGSRWLALSVAAALLVALIGVVTWRLSTNDEPFVAPPIVLPEAPKLEPAQLLPEQDERVPPVNVSEDQIKQALSDAAKLYEENQFGEAIAALEQIVEVAPSSVDAWMLLGEARLDNEERSAAEEAAHTVLALDPNHADAYLLLATMHIRDGKRDVGATEIARYLELEPNGKHADEAKRLLRR